MDYGLTILTLEVETASGEVYRFSIDRQNTVVICPWEDKAYTLISTGPIAIGLELRGVYKKRTIKGDTHTFKSAKVTNIVAKFSLNQLLVL